MDMIQEMYNFCFSSSETEKTLLEFDKELLQYIETNMEENEKAVFLTCVLITRCNHKKLRTQPQEKQKPRKPA